MPRGQRIEWALTICSSHCVPPLLSMVSKGKGIIFHVLLTGLHCTEFKNRSTVSGVSEIQRYLSDQEALLS